MRERLLSALTWAAAGAVVPVALLHFVGKREAHLSSDVHFWAVMLSAFAATGAAVALTAVGARRSDGRVVLVATAFSAMAALLAVHGLATPGQLVDQNGLGALTGGITLPVGGAILALTAVPGLWRTLRISTLIWLQAALLAAIVTVSTIGLVVPSLVPGVPETMSVAALALLAVGLAFFVTVCLRACRTWLLTRRRADLVVVVGIVWLSAALVPALTQSYQELGWWLGHSFEVIGIGFVGAVVAWDLHRTAQSRTLLGDLQARQLVSAEEAFLGSHVRALVLKLQEKDVYTEGHTRRVALLAVGLGEHLGRPAHQLRALAAGALLHDIGKLSIPDDVLTKPASLTPEELELIREHPARGERLLGELRRLPARRSPARPGAPRAARPKRVPRRRRRGEPRPRRAHSRRLRCLRRARLDAAVSRRLDARSSARADSQAGAAFDARCVQALAQVISRPEARPKRLTQPPTRSSSPLPCPRHPSAPEHPHGLRERPRPDRSAAITETEDHLGWRACRSSLRKRPVRLIPASGRCRRWQPAIPAP